MDYSTAFRRAYYGAAPHSFYVAFTWLAGGIVGDIFSVSHSIIFFLLAGILNFPVGELLRKYVIKSNEPLDKSNKVPMLFQLLSFAIPLSLPIIYFACKANINYFYPVFAMVIGAHYLPFYYGYRLVSFIIGGGLIWAAGFLIGFYFPDNFTIAAYATGGIVAVMALVNFISVRSELSLTTVDGKLNQIQ